MLVLKNDLKYFILFYHHTSLTYNSLIIKLFQSNIKKLSFKLCFQCKSAIANTCSAQGGCYKFLSTLQYAVLHPYLSIHNYLVHYIRAIFKINFRLLKRYLLSILINI